MHPKWIDDDDDDDDDDDEDDDATKTDIQNNDNMH